MPQKWYIAACAPQQMYIVLVTFSRAKSIISTSSFQYFTSSKGMVSTGAPVTIMPSNFIFFTSESVR